MATSEHKFCITFSKVMAEIPYVGLQMRRLLICFPTIFVMTFVADYLNTWIPSIQLSKRNYPVFFQTYENYRNTQLGHLHLTQILLWNVVEDWVELDEVESTMDVDWDGVESSQGRKYLNCSGIAPCEVQLYWMTDLSRRRGVIIYQIIRPPAPQSSALPLVFVCLTSFLSIFPLTVPFALPQAAWAKSPSSLLLSCPFLFPLSSNRSSLPYHLITRLLC